jgi:hypothetical protein
MVFPFDSSVNDFCTPCFQKTAVTLLPVKLDVLRGELMRGAHVRAVAVIPLVAAVLAACGGGDKEASSAPEAAGKVVHGQTETGMKMTVATFVPPASDPDLKRLDAYRKAGGYPPVDYHRVTADNTKGSEPDRERDITFARSETDIATGKGAPTAFACDVLNYQWPPNAKATQAENTALNKVFCAVKPNAPGGVPPGSKKVYYLVTDRSFGSRGLRSMNVYGPLSAQFK